MPSFCPGFCSLGPLYPQKEVGSSHKHQGQRLLSATTTPSPRFLPIITIPGSHSRPTVCQTLCSTGVRAKPLQLCLALCNPMNFNSLGSSVRGILQTRILEWVAVPSSRGSSQPRDQTWACCTGRGLFTTSATWEALRSTPIAPNPPDSHSEGTAQRKKARLEGRLLPQGHTARGRSTTILHSQSQLRPWRPLGDGPQELQLSSSP